MGTVGWQPFSGLSRDVWLGLSQSSGWAAERHSELSLSHSCIVLAVCIGSLSWWKVNFWPSLRSWAFWIRFSLKISLYFASSSFHSTLSSLPVPAAEKRPHTMLHCWDGIGQVMSSAWFPPDMTQNWGQTVQSWCHQTRESYFSQSESPWSIFLQTASRLSFVFHWGESGHSAIKPRSV